ncbi:MAG: Hsp20/alpha crystallin family protein [Deltaproteobacteria bacterium]|nr:Hsp20/alpha crystallin family protein [Deltaproteobacteria bacterium]
MTGADGQELTVRDKARPSRTMEQTRAGAVFTPEVDIFETDREITLLADIPGVRPEDLNIDLRDDVLTIAGETAAYRTPGEVDIITEYESGKFYRQFTLSEMIDQAKIDAKLNNGVLRLTLPKVEKATPRRIKVKTA